MKKLMFTLAAASLAGLAHADWIKTAGGTYDYNDPANWSDGKPNGVFPASLAIEGDQTITFAADTELPSGLTIAQTGTSSLSFKAASGSVTLTLGGDLTNTGSGAVTIDSSAKLDLGGKIRTVKTTKNLTLSSVISNGGLVLENSALLALGAANTFEGGLWLKGTGNVRITNKALGGEGGEVHLCSGASLHGWAKNGTNSVNAHHVFLEGDATLGTTAKDLGGINFANCTVSVMKPLTLGLNRYTFTFGALAATSPYTLLDVSYVGYVDDATLIGTLNVGTMAVPADKTLKLKQVNFSINDQNDDFRGTLQMEKGSLTIAKTLLPNATLDLRNVTLKLQAANGGEVAVAKSLTMRSGSLNVSGSTKAATTFKVGALSFLPGNATAQVKFTDNGSQDVVLESGSLACEHTLVNVTSDSATLGGRTRLHSESGAQLVGGILPWFRANQGGFMTYDTTVGVRPLTDEEQSVYSESTDALAFAAEGEQATIAGDVKATLAKSQTIASINVQGTGTTAETQPVLTAAEDATLTLSSGALNVFTKLAGGTEGAKFSIPVDFGATPGYITSRNGYRVDFTEPFHGTGGMVFSDLAASSNLNKENKGFSLRNGSSDYTGDVYIYGCVLPYQNGVFPYGEREGNLYLYGDLSFIKYLDVDLHVNALFGDGYVYQEGSATATFTIGDGNADGNFEGSFGTGKDSNFQLKKVGSGIQRFANGIAQKLDLEIQGGTLQIDGNVNLDNRYSIQVRNGATLAGCGTLLASSGSQVVINDGSVLAPGSAEKPNVPMTIAKNISFGKGATMKFYIDDARSSQAIVSVGKTVTIADDKMPVVVTSAAKKSGTWMLFEADSFGGKTFEKAKDAKGQTVSGQLTVVQVKDGETVTREQLWYTRNLGFTITLR